MEARLAVVEEGVEGGVPVLAHARPVPLAPRLHTHQHHADVERVEDLDIDISWYFDPPWSVR